MTAWIAVMHATPHLMVGGVELPLHLDDHRALLDHLTRIELWEARDPARAHQHDVRLSKGLVRTLPGRIAVATKTQKDTDTLNAGSLTEQLHAVPGTKRARLVYDADGEKVCIICGTILADNNPARKYCAPCVVEQKRVRARDARLRKAALRERNTCKECGGKFAPANGKQVYCTLACRDESKRKRMRQHDQPCPQCGTLVARTNGNQRFCRPECGQAARLEKSRNRPCQRCGEPLNAPRIRMHKHCLRENQPAKVRTCMWCHKPIAGEPGRKYHARCLKARDYIETVAKHDYQRAQIAERRAQRRAA